jgi:hypothetical protein
VTSLVQGPHFTDGSATGLLDEIRDLRRHRYASCSPHLLSTEVEARERRLKLDERAAHFLIRQSAGRLLGAVRLCPAPFESTELAVELASTDATFSRCFELSRLVCERRTGDPFLAARLLAFAGEWAAAQPGCEGLIAVCTRLRARVFHRYGMRPVKHEPLFLKDRPGSPYLLLHGDFPTARKAMRKALAMADVCAMGSRPLAA